MKVIKTIEEAHDAGDPMRALSNAEIAALQRGFARENNAAGITRDYAAMQNANKFINIDQKHRPRLVDHGHIVLTGLIAVIALLLLLALVLSVNEANALRGELVQNSAISPDAAEYMHRLGDGLIFDDQEVE
jgi:hypothetical protein